MNDLITRCAAHTRYLRTRSKHRIQQHLQCCKTLPGIVHSLRLIRQEVREKMYRDGIQVRPLCRVDALYYLGVGCEGRFETGDPVGERVRV